MSKVLALRGQGGMLERVKKKCERFSGAIKFTQIA